MEHVAIGRRADLAIGLEAVEQLCLGRLESGAFEIEIGPNLDDAALAFHRTEQRPQPSYLRGRQLERLGELFQIGWMESRFLERLLDTHAELALVATQLDLVRLEPQDALLAHDLGLADEAVEQRAKRPRSGLVRKPRPQCLHLEAA